MIKLEPKKEVQQSEELRKEELKKEELKKQELKKQELKKEVKAENLKHQILLTLELIQKHQVLKELQVPRYQLK